MYLKRPIRRTRRRWLLAPESFLLPSAFLILANNGGLQPRRLSVIIRADFTWDGLDTWNRKGRLFYGADRRFKNPSPGKDCSSMAKLAGISKTQVFRYKAPDAKKVLLAGDFTDWQNQAIPMKKEKDGIWTATVGLSVGPHEYLFIVDGQWSYDPDCGLRMPNSFGGENMVRQVV
jgi:hypothetical protein